MSNDVCCDTIWLSIVCSNISLTDWNCILRRGLTIQSRGEDQMDVAQKAVRWDPMEP